MANNEYGVSRRDFIGSAIAAGGAITLAKKGLWAEPAAANPVDIPVALNVNGTEHQLELDPRVTLLDALREKLHLTGTKKGCDHGQCGAWWPDCAIKRLATER